MPEAWSHLVFLLLLCHTCNPSANSVSYFFKIPLTWLFLNIPPPTPGNTLMNTKACNPISHPGHIFHKLLSPISTKNTFYLSFSQNLPMVSNVPMTVKTLPMEPVWSVFPLFLWLHLWVISPFIYSAPSILTLLSKNGQISLYSLLIHPAGTTRVFSKHDLREGFPDILHSAPVTLPFWLNLLPYSSCCFLTYPIPVLN